MKTKKCAKCDCEKPLTNFKTPRGRVCLDCQQRVKREKQKRWEIRYPERSRRSDRQAQLKRLYDMTLEDHDRLLEQQGGSCAGCGATEFNSKSYHLAVDHDHETGEIRGLLCLKCNRILGLAQDDPELLRRLANYLEHRVAEVGSQTL